MNSSPCSALMISMSFSFTTSLVLWSKISPSRINPSISSSFLLTVSSSSLTCSDLRLFLASRSADLSCRSSILPSVSFTSSFTFRSSSFFAVSCSAASRSLVSSSSSNPFWVDSSFVVTLRYSFSSCGEIKMGLSIYFPF